jgi:hypothetical protein
MVQHTIMLVMTPPQSGPESDRGHHGGGFGDGAGHDGHGGDMNGTESKSGLGPLGRRYLRGLRRNPRGDATKSTGYV